MTPTTPTKKILPEEFKVCRTGNGVFCTPTCAAIFGRYVPKGESVEPVPVTEEPLTNHSVFQKCATCGAKLWGWYYDRRAFVGR